MSKLSRGIGAFSVGLSITVAGALPAQASTGGGGKVQPGETGKAAVRSAPTYLVNRHSGKCLTVHGASTKKGAKVDQYRCVGASNQRWTMVQNQYWFVLVNQRSGLCLAVPGGSKSKGIQLIQWTCNGASDQYWHFNQQSKGFFIGNKKTGKVVDIRGASTANNAPAVQWTWNQKTNQLWHH